MQQGIRCSRQSHTVGHSLCSIPLVQVSLACFAYDFVAGITLSQKQVERGTQLAAERGLKNVKFMVRDNPA